MYRIKLFLQNNMSVTLGDVRSGKPGWRDCDPAGIKKLEFSFMGNGGPHTLVLSGMKEYNFFVEAMKAVGSNKDAKIMGLWFMGKVPDSNLVKGFVLKDSVLVLNSEIGKEYHGTSTVGWKTGIVGDPVIATIVRR